MTEFTLNPRNPLSTQSSLRRRVQETLRQVQLSVGGRCDGHDFDCNFHGLPASVRISRFNRAVGLNGQLNMQFNPAPALGGTNNRLDVSNAYNQVEIVATCRESTNSWPYSVAAMRPANNSINNRVTFVTGTGGLFVSASAIATGTHSSTVNERYSGVGIDSIAAASGLISGSSGTANHVTVNLAEFNGMIGLGSHFVQWLESGNGTITATWYGDNGTPLLIQSGLKVKRTM